MRKTVRIAVIAALFTLVLAGVAMAQEGGGLDSSVKSMIALSCGLGIAIAAFGGALGQGKAAAAAIEGIARNPGAYQKVFTPMILGLALIESLVIYSLLISFLLVFKL
ncbi:MAG: ATP synthase F0 subunit C [Myxococcales bacterium]|nr:ATP synthase F0 subunit C [Myxococcales bacterium]